MEGFLKRETRLIEEDAEEKYAMPANAAGSR